MPRSIAFLAGFALLIGAPDADAQKRKESRIPKAWLSDLDSARKASRERNTPIIVVIIQEGEEANDRYRDGIYRSTKFAQATKHAIVLLVNDGQHPQKKIVEERDGEKFERQVCQHFETPGCAAHRRNMTRIFQEYTQGEEMTTPQTIAILPNGKIHKRLMDVPALSQVIGLVLEAHRIAGPSVSAEQLDRIKKHLDTAMTMTRARLWVEAWRAYASALEVTEYGFFADEARQGRDVALAGMKSDLDAALEKMKTGAVEDGFGQLMKLRAGFEGTPLQKEIEKTIKSAERNKEWKDAIRSWKRKQDAEELWKRVVEALAAEKQKTAERHAKTILKRFGDTPAADRVRERFPHFEKDDGRLAVRFDS